MLLIGSGIASVMNKIDSFEKHINDTLIAGAGMCDPEAVEMLVKEGPERIKDLINIGAHFALKNGKINLATEGEHTIPRIVHIKDLTGKDVERVLINSVN